MLILIVNLIILSGAWFVNKQFQIIKTSKLVELFFN